MFTGIVQCKAKVYLIKSEKGVSHLIIKVANEYAQAIEIGASIAINGVCLTVVKQTELPQNRSLIHFDVIDETLRVTNLSTVKVNDLVNYERSLKVGDEIGGHQMSGHIQGRAIVDVIEYKDGNCSIKLSLLMGDKKYLFEKGFIAINGCSLTLGFIEQNSFYVHLIPETLQRSNIGQLSHGDIVNIEFDQQTITIVNTIERMKLMLV